MTNTAALASTWTIAKLAELPAVIPAYLADEILGIGSNLGQELRAREAYPIRVLRIGRLHKVATAELLRYLAIAVIDESPTQLGPQADDQNGFEG